MEFKYETSIKFLVFGYIFVSLEIHSIHSYQKTIQLFPQASDIFGKTGLEAEMAYFTQNFSFVNDKDEFGESMLNFLKKYLEMRKGKRVSRNLHWKNEKDDVHYILRGNHCYNYLADGILINSGIQYEPAQLFVNEKMYIIKLDYYTYDDFNLPALRCRVKVGPQFTYLYFINFTNDNTTGSSYFVLASKPSSSRELELSIVMYTNRRMLKFNEKELLEVPPLLQSVNEESVLSDHRTPTISRDDPIDFRKLLMMPDGYFQKGNSRVVWFGKDAERVFITSNNFQFVNMELENSYVDKFIRLARDMKTGSEIQFATSISEFKYADYKAQVCENSIKSNAALQFHNIIPASYEQSPEIQFTPGTRTIIFPRTRLPEVDFQFPMLPCPALVGDEKKPIIVYVQVVLYRSDTKRRKRQTFALLKSRLTPGAVYPVTLTEPKYDFSYRSVWKNIPEQAPSIYEDEELGPVIEEPTTEASTSSVGADLPET